MRSDERKKELGEVFTPPELVNEMLDKLPREVIQDSDKTFLDNSCGSGNFLIEILNRRISAGISHIAALQSIYGIDIDELNVTECRERLSLGDTDAKIWEILNHNIILADALDIKHPGWFEVGYMWKYHLGWAYNDGVLTNQQTKRFW